MIYLNGLQEPLLDLEGVLWGPSCYDDVEDLFVFLWGSHARKIKFFLLVAQSIALAEVASSRGSIKILPEFATFCNISGL